MTGVPVGKQEHEDETQRSTQQRIWIGSRVLVTDITIIRWSLRMGDHGCVRLRSAAARAAVPYDVSGGTA
eukprot:5322987-Prymnesium_polylepis.1